MVKAYFNIAEILKNGIKICSRKFTCPLHFNINYCTVAGLLKPIKRYYLLQWVLKFMKWGSFLILKSL